MTHQHQHQEMQPSIVGQRSCHLSGSANLTVWYRHCQYYIHTLCFHDSCFFFMKISIVASFNTGLNSNASGTNVHLEKASHRHSRWRNQSMEC